MFEIYHLFEKLLNLSVEKFHEILVIEYFEKAAVIFAIKIPKINCQGYYFLEMLGAEPKSPKFYEE